MPSENVSVGNELVDPVCWNPGPKRTFEDLFDLRGRLCDFASLERNLALFSDD